MTTYFAPTTPARPTVLDHLRDRILPAFVAAVTFALLLVTFTGIGYAVDPRLAVLFLLGVLMIGANALAVVALSTRLNNALHEDDAS